MTMYATSFIEICCKLIYNMLIQLQVITFLKLNSSKGKDVEIYKEHNEGKNLTLKTYHI